MRVNNSECMSGTTIASLASRAANAISEGRAYVVPGWLSGDALEATRAETLKMLAATMEGFSDEFESIETDLLDPESRHGLPTTSPLLWLAEEVEELRLALATETGRALLQGGGLHMMRYPVGSKFGLHADEDPSLYEPQRNSISFLIYLTPNDWKADDGGALHLFEQGEDGDSRKVLPLGGTLVIYDSEIEHEVSPTLRERHLLSGRFRELNEDWEKRRRVFD